MSVSPSTEDRSTPLPYPEAPAPRPPRAVLKRALFGACGLVLLIPTDAFAQAAIGQAIDAVPRTPRRRKTSRSPYITW